MPCALPAAPAAGARDVPALPAELTHRQARQTLDALQQQLRSAKGHRTNETNETNGTNGTNETNGTNGTNGSSHGASAWLVDASALQVFDSSALAVLLECRRSALAAGQGFAVRGLPTALAGLAALYGVADMLPAAA